MMLLELVDRFQNWMKVADRRDEKAGDRMQKTAVVQNTAVQASRFCVRSCRIASAAGRLLPTA